jgi:transcriptional regulator with XRE-family HTH domain
MEVYEKINDIIKKKNMTKREFANILRSLEPRLRSTDQAPVETTIYKYLNGQVSIPIEIITFIAEALDVTEQELFDDSLKVKIKFLKSISNDQKVIQAIDKMEQNQKIGNALDAIMNELQSIKDVYKV